MDIAKFLAGIKMMDVFFLFLIAWGLGLAYLLGRVQGGERARVRTLVNMKRRMTCV